MAHEREFVDHAAHELKTPLTALKLQTQLIAKTLGDKPERKEVDELLLSVNRTARLVDQLLQLSRLSSQVITLSKINLYEVAKEVAALHAVSALQKNITLSLEGEETLMISAQPELLGTLIGTLLENAIKYTPENGSVAIKTEKLTSKAILIITDTGPGIPEDQRDRVFERFYRMNENNQPGSGLGLAIAQQVVMLLNATISLESSPGEGLSAILRFNLV